LAYQEATTQLQRLIHRTGKVLAVMHPPTAAHARTMEAAGAECCFVGTSGVVGAYTGMSDVGAATMTECVTIAGWIARAVTMPVIIDGDTGHGGIMAVRRLIRESIHAGIAGIRIDDQPIEGKRATQSAGIEVVELEQAIARYRAAVDMKNELDPNFVIMAQCYTRDAANGGLDECLRRLQAYEQEAGVDWVQFESPHNVQELQQARAVVKGPMSFMKGRLPRYLTLKEHLDMGYTIAWLPSFTHHVTHQALWEFMQDFWRRTKRTPISRSRTRSTKHPASSACWRSSTSRPIRSRSTHHLLEALLSDSSWVSAKGDAGRHATGRYRDFAP
jgi:2,3-dimethylmalate lyase